MSRLRLALRLAWRDARTHRTATALTALLVAVPVVALVVVAILGRTLVINAGVKDTWLMGRAQALLTDDRQFEDHPDGRPISQLLPAGTKVLADNDYDDRLVGAHPSLVDVRAFDYADPLAAGTIHQLTGRAPMTAGETVISSELASATGLRIGDSLDLASGPHLRVVGTFLDPNVVRRRSLIVTQLPAHLPTAVGVTLIPSYLVEFPASVVPHDVSLVPGLDLQLRTSLQVPLGRHLDADTVSTGALVGVLALLEATLTAGTAFAVGARRSRRDLALIAVNGGRKRDVGAFVLARGIVFGTIGVAVGFAGGLAIAAGSLPTLQAHTDYLLEGLRFDYRLLIPAALFGLLVSVLASLLPAWLAARSSLRSALGGTRGTSRTPGWITATGAGVFALGVAVVTAAVSGRSGGSDYQTTTALLGVVFVELGGVAVCPALLGVAGRLGRRLPPLPRLALRDASRQRARSGPAVAAIAAAVSGVVATSIYAASLDAHNVAVYQPLLPKNVVTISAEGTSEADARSQAAAVLPPSSSVVAAPLYSLTDERYATGTDGTFLGLIEAAGPGILPALGITGSPATAFASGTPLVLGDSPTSVRIGGRLMTAQEYDGPAAGVQGLPNVLIPFSQVPSDKLRLETIVAPIDANLSHSARVALVDRAADQGVALNVELGPSRDDELLVISILATAAAFSLIVTAAATALAAQEAREDVAVLGAIGATGRIRRLFTSAQAWTMTLLGGTLGVAIGLVPGIAVVRSDVRHMALVLPWQPFVIFLIGLPLLAAAGGFTFSRAKLPALRRAL